VKLQQLIPRCISCFAGSLAFYHVALFESYSVTIRLLRQQELMFVMCGNHVSSASTWFCVLTFILFYLLTILSSVSFCPLDDAHIMLVINDIYTSPTVVLCFLFSLLLSLPNLHLNATQLNFAC